MSRGPADPLGEPRARSLPRLGRSLLPLLIVALVASACGLPRWPADGPVTSAFGVRWRGWLPEVHRGIDIGVPIGTPVRSMAGGRVRYAGWQSGYGNVVWIDHGGAVLTVYAHLSALRVTTGQVVDGGQLIAESGASGHATGPHLHFEIWRWGRQTDPLPLLGRPPEDAGPPGR